MTDFPGPHEHYETKRRAWCNCGEWCYIASGGEPCMCCQQALAEDNPCLRCGGTGEEPPSVTKLVAQLVADDYSGVHDVQRGQVGDPGPDATRPGATWLSD